MLLSNYSKEYVLELCKDITIPKKTEVEDITKPTEYSTEWNDPHNCQNNGSLACAHVYTLANLIADSQDKNDIKCQYVSDLIQVHFGITKGCESPEK